MKKYLLAILAMLSSACAWGRAPDPSDSCARVQFTQSAETTKTLANGFTVFKTMCYADESGSYVLYLLVDKSKAARARPLPRALQVQLFKLTGGALSQQAVARDAAAAGETGVEFLPELIEMGDIDGDGTIDPVIVYRFYRSDDDSDGSDDFSGRIKLITFYKGEKVAIRAVTGMLDDARSTTASPNFFILPKKAQGHLVAKMKRMYENRQFGFDNSYGFKPRRED